MIHPHEQGRRQSPINIEPTSLSYDSRLGALSIDKHLINAKITNTGQTLLLKAADGEAPVNITGGPLAYGYQFQEMRFHWGRRAFQAPNIQSTSICSLQRFSCMDLILTSTRASAWQGKTLEGFWVWPS